MIILQAPYPNLNTSIVLPDPRFGDTKANNIQLAEKIGIDNTIFTYIKRPGTTRLNFAFEMDIEKAYELINFHNAFKDVRIKLTFEDEMWDVKCLTNPIEWTETQRGMVEIAIDFSGKIINA